MPALTFLPYGHLGWGPPGHQRQRPGGGRRQRRWKRFVYDTVNSTASTWTFCGDDGGWVYGVSNSGQVVGTDMPAGTAYLWTSAGAERSRFRA